MTLKNDLYLVLQLSLASPKNVNRTEMHGHANTPPITSSDPATSAPAVTILLVSSDSDMQQLLMGDRVFWLELLQVRRGGS